MCDGSGVMAGKLHFNLISLLLERSLPRRLLQILFHHLFRLFQFLGNGLTLPFSRLNLRINLFHHVIPRFTRVVRQTLKWFVAIVAFGPYHSRLSCPLLDLTRKPCLSWSQQEQRTCSNSHDAVEVDARPYYHDVVEPEQYERGNCERESELSNQVAEDIVIPLVRQRFRAVS